MIDKETMEQLCLHLRRKTRSNPDTIMVGRLERILQGALEMTDTDRRFYVHTLRMVERFRAMGIADDFIPKSNPSIWNNVHTAALEDLKLSDDETLRYTNEAIEVSKRQELQAYENVTGTKVSITALEQIVKNESVKDLLLVFAISLAFPSIDRLFGRYRFEVIANGELVRTYEQLFHDGVIAEGVAAIAVKGLNWDTPDFVTIKKYA
ncbi:hypothetical protein [Pseudomonas sp. PP3]|uniref:hypothetical protein n=1 Tax=Pseudomonas sp. PP3 TaxID=2815936 RepID=UPI001FD3020E|nr:hypothetical protein [Pseudomonas sp. PP3]